MFSSMYKNMHVSSRKLKYFPILFGKQHFSANQLTPPPTPFAVLSDLRSKLITIRISVHSGQTPGTWM